MCRVPPGQLYVMLIHSMIQDGANDITSEGTLDYTRLIGFSDALKRKLPEQDAANK